MVITDTVGLFSGTEANTSKECFITGSKSIDCLFVKNKKHKSRC